MSITQRSRELLIGGAVSCVYLLLMLPVVMGDSRGATDYAHDETKYHLPTIHNIAEHWPSLDIVGDLLTATPPGYHYVLAGLQRKFSVSDHGLVVINAAVSLLVILVIYHHLTRYVGGWKSLALISPLLFSNYFLKSSCYLGTDNAALLFVVLSLNALLRSSSSTMASLASGAWAFFATTIRQNNVWLAAPIIARAALKFLPGHKCLHTDRRMRDVVIALAAVVPMAALVAFLAIRWRGLTPPMYQGRHTTISLMPALFALSMLGAFGVLYLPLLDRKFLAETLFNRRALMLAVVAAVFAVLPNSNYDSTFEVGRRGGVLWSIAARLPEVANRSIVFPPLAVAGAMTLLCVFQLARRVNCSQEVFLLFIAGFAWAAAQCPNRIVAQRYFEPMALLFLAYLFASLLQRAEPKSSWQYGGILLLTMIQMTVTAFTLLRLVVA